MKTKTQQVTLEDLAAGLDCPTNKLMKQLALIGWGELMNHTTKVAHSEYFAGLDSIPMKDRRMFSGPEWRHLMAVAKEWFPELVGPNPKKLGMRRQGWIYVLYDGQTKLCKIGRTQTTGKRQQALMGAHAGVLVNVMNAEVDDCFAAEGQCHKFFQKNRKNGEWFEADLAEVILYIGEELGATKIDFENPARLAQYICASELDNIQMAFDAMRK
jgi:hypothetical protein